MLISISVAVFSIMKAKKFYTDDTFARPNAIAKRNKGLYNLLYKKYKLDELYFALVVDVILKASKDFLWKVFDIKFM